jgi:uncharacterized protein (TIGR02145 family)
MKRILYLLTISALLIAIFTNCKKDIAVVGVKLNNFYLTLEVGETQTLIATVVPSEASNKLVSWRSHDPTVASVTSSGQISAHSDGKTTIVVTTIDGNYTAECAVTIITADQEEEGVIINGIKWATRNVRAPGKFTAHYYDPGMFYQWNRKVGWSSTDPLVNSDGGTTWDDSSPSGYAWERENDPCPDGWRVPTRAELASLGNGVWTNTPTAGSFFGSDENSIFLPAAGARYNSTGEHYSVYKGGLYWSSTANAVYGGYCFYLLFDNTNAISHFSINPAYGFSVRCVAED